MSTDRTVEPTKDKWEWQLDNKFPFGLSTDIDTDVTDEVKAFIKDLTLSRDRELVEAIEKEKKTGAFNRSEEIRIPTEAWNSALSKAQSLIGGE